MDVILNNERDIYIFFLKINFFQLRFFIEFYCAFIRRRHFLERKNNYCNSDKGLKGTVVNRTFHCINHWKTKKCCEKDNSILENSFPAFLFATFDTLPIYSFLNDSRILIKNCVQPLILQYTTNLKCLEVIKDLQLEYFLLNF